MVMCKKTWRTIEQSEALRRLERISSIRSTIVDTSNIIHVLTYKFWKICGEKQQLSSRDHFFTKHALASHNLPAP